MNRAIPFGEDPERYYEIDFIDSPFVEVTSESGIDVAMQYPLLGMRNGESRCFMRREVYQKLLKAQSLLPEGMFIRVWDAWRPFALQEELYHVYGARILENSGLQNASQEEKQQAISQYVSLPIPDRDCPPLHTTGGAVDVTLIDADGKELNMGTPFDSFSEQAAVAFFEKGGEECIRDRRRILYHAMCDAGFTGLASEWWHYDYGDRSWAYFCKSPALYRGVFSVEEIKSVDILK